MLPLIVGVSGASGVVYAIRLLEVLKQLDIPTHLVVTKAAVTTLSQETEHPLGYLRSLAHHWHRSGDIGSSIASGSVITRGMVVIPCSMNTVASIAAGITTNLLTRAVDVTLKERRRVVLVPRETPLHLGHLRNLVTVTELGAIVAPPVPEFYSRPHTLQDVIDQTVGRVLQLFDIHTGLVTPWRADPLVSPHDLSAGD